MKQLLAFLFIFGMFIFVACGDDCDGENPRAKLINNGTDVADVQIKTSGGNTDNINNIAVGDSSPWESFAPGDVEFTITVKNVTPTYLTINMKECMDYEIRIDSTNNVEPTIIDRNE